MRDCDFVTCVLPVDTSDDHAVKYAHRRRRAIKETSKRDDATIAIEVSDDGVGLPDDIDPLQSQSISFRTIRTLAKQIGASISFDNYGLELSCCLELPYTLRALKAV